MTPRILERAEHPVSRRDIDPNVLKVLYRLGAAGHQAYLVGGGVRDLMLGRRPKDFDIATSAHPHEVRQLFRNSRLIGRRFRLVHVFFGSQNIEVATFRRTSEEEPTAEDPLIQRDNTFGTAAEDAFRRDFTINSLFYDCRTFRVIDHTGGVADLGERLIRTIGDPEVRMREDPVRMIRAVRLAARLDFEIEPATRAAIERHCNDLGKASAPRVAEEIFRTLGGLGARRALLLAEQLGLVAVLLPALSEHLRPDLAVPERLRTAANLGSLERELASGREVGRGAVLACLFLDLYLHRSRQNGHAAGADLARELRTRGFSRADSEQMRLLLEALGALFNLSSRVRRLARRPYFAEAMRLWELLGPNYGVEADSVRRMLEAPSHAGRRSPEATHDTGVAQASVGGGQAPGRRRSRRRRRRGGWRRRKTASSRTTPGNLSQDARSVPTASPTHPVAGERDRDTERPEARVRSGDSQLSPVEAAPDAFPSVRGNTVR